MPQNHQNVTGPDCTGMRQRDRCLDRKRPPDTHRGFGKTVSVIDQRLSLIEIGPIADLCSFTLLKMSTTYRSNYHGRRSSSSSASTLISRKSAYCNAGIQVAMSLCPTQLTSVFFSRLSETLCRLRGFQIEYTFNRPLVHLFHSVAKFNTYHYDESDHYRGNL